MLNKNGIRELAYVVKIDDIQPIIGSDNCEAAIVGGWKVMVRKETFKPGDLAVYFEIDSKVPETEVFEFLAKKHYKIKTQKYTFGGANKEGFYSQGLLMHFNDFGWEKDAHKEGDFLTEELGVTYAEPEDNKRKSSGSDKYKKMAARHPKLFQNPIIKKIYKNKTGKKILFFFFGKKQDKLDFPSWVIKTDEERIQNLQHMIPEFCKEKWIATEKIDGTSTTFTLHKRGHKKFEYAVCSRNVRMTEFKNGGYYENNVYTEMSTKYNMKNVLLDMLNRAPKCDYVTIQGETYGEGIQKRNYNTKEHNLVVFNVIFGKDDGLTLRLNPLKMKELMDCYNIPTVPIIAEDVELPETCDEILVMAHGKSQFDDDLREGIVFRNYDATKSFKAVDNEFLLKYHG